MALLALTAETVSYLHMHTLVELHGQPGWVAALTPLSVDGMIVAGVNDAGAGPGRRVEQQGPQLIQRDQPVGQPGGEGGGVQGQRLRPLRQRPEGRVRGIQRAERGTAGLRGSQHGRRDRLAGSWLAGRASGPGVITHGRLLVTGSGRVRKPMQPAAIDLPQTCDGPLAVLPQTPGWPGVNLPWTWQ